MKYLIAHLILKPLIRHNYRLRAAGKLPDEWYWADRLAISWGYAWDLRAKFDWWLAIAIAAYVLNIIGWCAYIIMVSHFRR